MSAWALPRRVGERRALRRAAPTRAAFERGASRRRLGRHLRRGPSSAASGGLQRRPSSAAPSARPPQRGPSPGGRSARGRVEELVLADGTRVATDHVVEAVGVRPASAWFAGAALDPHVYLAGDVTGSGHWEAAARQGAGVARALLGLPPAPPAPASFWSDQLGLRLQCVGDPAGARAELAVDAEGRGFEAVYRRGGRVSAVLLAGRSAADLRAARRRLSPTPELERSAA